MNSNDNIILRGDFTMHCIDADGKVLETLTEPNLVVTLGKTNLCKLMGGNIAGEKISQIAVGEGTAAPDVADVGPLTNQFKKAFDTTTYPDANSVLFSWTLTTSEGNGMSITEFGLLNDSDILCARKTRAAIVKTSAFSIVGSWKIYVN